MNIYKLLYFFPLLFGFLLADYDDDRSPLIQKDWDKIKKVMSTAHKNCYQFVTPMQRKHLDPNPYYEDSLHFMRQLTKDPDTTVYREYLQTTLGNGETMNSALTSMRGLDNVFEAVSQVAFDSVVLFTFYFFLKYFPPAKKVLLESTRWVRRFEISVTILACFAYFLLADTLEFWSTAEDAQDHLRYSQTWNRDFHLHHTTYVDKKNQQFQCIADQYWEGYEAFRQMSGPFFVYREALMKTPGVFGEFDLGSFISKYRGNGIIPHEKDDTVFYVTYRLMNSIHLKINKSEPWGPDKQVHEFRDLFNDYYWRILQLPEQHHFKILKWLVAFMTTVTLIIALGFGYAPFWDEVALRKMTVNILQWGQNAILLFTLVTAGMFGYLLSQVAGAYMVQEALLDTNMTFLKGIESKNGLDLGAIFGESLNPNKTLIEIYFKTKFIFDARREIFTSKVSREDLMFLDKMFSAEEISKRFPTSYHKNVSQIINMHNLFRGIVYQLGFETYENKYFFPGIIFGINYHRFATAILKHVIIPVSTPVWSLLRLPLYHFLIALWVLVALPHIKDLPDEQNVKYKRPA